MFQMNYWTRDGRTIERELLRYSNPTLLELAMVSTMILGETTQAPTRWQYRLPNGFNLLLNARFGKPHGEFNFFYPSGAIAVCGEYNFGERTDTSLYFRSNGEPWNRYEETTNLSLVERELKRCRNGRG